MNSKRMPEVWAPNLMHTDNMLKFIDNLRYWSENSNSIKRDYAGKFIAIHGAKVILSEADANDLLNKLPSKISKKEISKAYLAYVPKHEVIVV